MLPAEGGDNRWRLCLLIKVCHAGDLSLWYKPMNVIQAEELLGTCCLYTVIGNGVLNISSDPKIAIISCNSL